MALSKERLGEIAMLVLQNKLEKNGDLKLIPSQVKRELKNSAKTLGFSVIEVAEFSKIILTSSFKKTIIELDKIIKGKVED